MTTQGPIMPSTAPRDHIPNRIKVAAKVIGYATWLDDPDAWPDAARALAGLLTRRERAGLALATLESLPQSIADVVAEEAVFGRNPE